MKNEIVLFKNQQIKLEVNMKEENVWLTQKQMALLFDKDQNTINEHISNIFAEGELDEITSTGISGKSSGGRKPKIYNLDVIISVGYRVKSKNIITYEECMKIINDLKFNNDSNLFALERNEGLKAILGNIYQSFDNKDLYPTTEEKIANLLYLTVKNHVFIDGNKRIAATLFIYALNYYDLLYVGNKQVIDNNTLVAITLLIAESNPKEKEVLVDLILNFLNNK